MKRYKQNETDELSNILKQDGIISGYIKKKMESLVFLLIQYMEYVHELIQ